MKTIKILLLQLVIISNLTALSQEAEGTKNSTPFCEIEESAPQSPIENDNPVKCITKERSTFISNLSFKQKIEEIKERKKSNSFIQKKASGKGWLVFKIILTLILATIITLISILLIATSLNSWILPIFLSVMAVIAILGMIAISCYLMILLFRAGQSGGSEKRKQQKWERKKAKNEKKNPTN